MPLLYNTDLRKGFINYLISSENINLSFGNKLKKLKLLFVSGLSNALSKFVIEAYRKREQNLT